MLTAIIVNSKRARYSEDFFSVFMYVYLHFETTFLVQCYYYKLLSDPGKLVCQIQLPHLEKCDPNFFVHIALCKLFSE